ncbi:hypothetical protein Tco_1547214 [Tanacetum coccineum]
MDDLAFIQQHNMVAYLEKNDGNADFHQILDFLTSSSINFALTINGKAVVVSESSVRRDLHLNDKDGTVCLTVNEIIENLALMGYETASDKLTFYKVATATASQPPKDPNTYRRTKRGRNTKVPQSGGSPKKVGDEAINEEMLDSVERAITTDASLDATHDSDNITKTQYTTTLNEPHPQGEGSGSGPWSQETMEGAPDQTKSERVLEQPIEPPLSEGHTSGSGEGSMEYHFELTDNVPPTPHDSPLSGGNTPGSDEGRMELIKELMETCTSLTKRVLALEKAKTAQDRVINRLRLRVKRPEKKRKTRTPQPMKRRLFKGRVKTSIDTRLGEDASKQRRSSDKTKPMFKDSDFNVLDAEQITTTGPSHVSTVDQVSTARPEVSVATPYTPPTTATVFDDEDVTMAMAQTLIKMKEVKAKEKGVEFRNVKEASRPVRSITTLQPLPKIDPKDKEFDEIQARIDTDALFAAKLQRDEREREQFTIEERAQFLVKTIASQRKFRVAQRDAEIRRKTYEEIHELYKRQQKRNQDFIPMDSEKEAQKSVPFGPWKPVLVSLWPIRHRPSEVNYEPLSRRFPIVNWESKLLGNVDAKDMYVLKLTRADGSSSYHGDMQAFLRRLDKQDLNDLYRLVQERFQDHPLEGHDLFLWGDLRMLFDQDEKDELWMNQLDWKLLKWKLHENCEVHTLFMDGTPMEITMLVEKKYLLIKELLEKVLNLQLEAEEESTMAFELIKFIKSMLEE